MDSNKVCRAVCLIKYMLTFNTLQINCVNIDIMKKDKKKSKTQSSDSCSQTCTNMDCLRLHQLVPSSPPPSYEVSLQKVCRRIIRLLILDYIIATN